MKRLLAILVLSAACLAAGCGWISSVSRTQTPPGRQVYLQILDRWTERREIYRDIEKPVYVTALYKSVPFRKAYVREYARSYLVSPQETARMQAEQMVLAEGRYEFLLSLAAPTDNETALTPVSGSPWRIYLETPAGERLEPEEIRPLKYDSPRMESFYPFISPWAKAYQVRFRTPGPQPDAGKLNLILTGVLGRAILSYNLED